MSRAAFAVTQLANCRYQSADDERTTPSVFAAVLTSQPAMSRAVRRES